MALTSSCDSATSALLSKDFEPETHTSNPHTQLYYHLKVLQRTGCQATKSRHSARVAISKKAALGAEVGSQDSKTCSRIAIAKAVRSSTLKYPLSLELYQDDVTSNVIQD